MSGRVEVGKIEQARPAAKILAGLSEAVRATALKNAVSDVARVEMTDQEAIEVLACVDAVDPLRKA